MADEINLDTGTPMAFVAEGSGIRHQLKAYVQGKILVMTQTALQEFQNALLLWAGPIEQARALRFLAKIRIINDSPSSRAQALRVTRNLQANDIVILGTGDHLGIVTMTTDARALRAARAQGVAFFGLSSSIVSVQGDVMMVDTVQAADLPDYFQSTLEMVRAAFPEGINDENYYPLLVLLSEGIGQRGLARFMAALTGKPMSGVYNDVLGVQSPDPVDKPAPERVEEAKRRLQAHGYDEWVAEEP